MNPFQPQYLTADELDAFGLPTPDCNARIVNLVQMASTAIDEWCGRIDGDGNGSLVWSTYTERILVQSLRSNIIQLAIKPMAVVTFDDVQDLMASGAVGASGSNDNTFYTGVVPNSLYQPNGTPTCLLGASGRFGSPRRDMMGAYSDWSNFTNPLDLSRLFGGSPEPWRPIDVRYVDFDVKTGELWIPSSFFFQNYSEVSITYNAGFDPRRVPKAVKFATAAVVKNALAKGEGTTALTSLTLGRAGASFQFGPQLIDNTIDSWLTPYKIVRAA